MVGYSFRLLPPNHRLLPPNHSMLPPNDGLLPANEKKTGEKQQKSGQKQQKSAAELPPKQPRWSRKGGILFRPTDERNHNPNLPRRTWYEEAQKANAAGSEKAANRIETHEK